MAASFRGGATGASSQMSNSVPLVITYTNGALVGDLLLLIVKLPASPAPSSAQYTVTDNKGQTWTQAGAFANGSLYSVVLYTCVQTVASNVGGITVTATPDSSWATSTHSVTGILYNFTGQTSWTLDQLTTATGTYNGASTQNETLTGTGTTSGELFLNILSDNWVSSAGHGSATPSAGTGLATNGFFYILGSGNNIGDIIAGYNIASTMSIGGTITLSPADNLTGSYSYMMILVSFTGGVHQYTHSPTDTVSTIDMTNWGWSFNPIESILSLASVVRLFTGFRSSSETISLADTAVRIAQRVRALSETVSTADSVARSARLQRSPTETLSLSDGMFAGHVVLAAITTVLSAITDAVSRVFTGQRSPTDIIPTVTESISRKTSFQRLPSETSATSDTLLTQKIKNIILNPDELPILIDGARTVLSVISDTITLGAETVSASIVRTWSAFATEYLPPQATNNVATHSTIRRTVIQGVALLPIVTAVNASQPPPLVSIGSTDSSALILFAAGAVLSLPYTVAHVQFFAPRTTVPTVRFWPQNNTFTYSAPNTSTAGFDIQIVSGMVQANTTYSLHWELV